MNIYYEGEDPNEKKEPSNTEYKENLNKETPNDGKKKNRKIFYIIPVVIILLAVVGYFSYKHLANTTPPEIANTDSCIAKTNSDIYDYYKNSIVMVKHKFGIQVRIADHEPIIIQTNSLDNFETFASGFFVDGKGHIMTNQHVVSTPDTYSEQVQTEVKNLEIKLLANLPKDTDPTTFEEKINQIIRGENIAVNNEPEVDADMESDTIDLDIEPTVVEYFSKGEISIEPVALELSIMLHDTNEWIPCKIIKISDSHNIDLALIQLNSESTPQTVVNYIQLNNVILDDSTIKPGTKAIMIGFPMGMNLANTESGIIKTQMYEGNINRESDGVKFQYSIPATQGASGAPVFNSCGQLIAVNFSGYEQQGFNFGIVAKHIHDLVKPYVDIEQLPAMVENLTETAN